MRKLLRKQGFAPELLTTDPLFGIVACPALMNRDYRRTIAPNSERLFSGRESRSDPFDERCRGHVAEFSGYRLGIFLSQFEHALNCAQCGFMADDLLLDEYMQKALAKKQRHFSFWIRSGFGGSHERQREGR
jgi:hypothetical protein